MKKLFLALAVLCVLGLIASFPVQSSYRGKAKMIQRIEKSDSSELFGDEGTPIGAPTLMIINDEKAFIGQPDDSSLYKVDEAYLTKNQIHPLQLKTVDFLASNSRVGFGIAGLIFGFIGWRMKRRATVADGS